jgi:hypothetical protein
MKTNFYKRFNLEIDVDEAAERFVNRISNTLFDLLLREPYVNESQRDLVNRLIATGLGDEYVVHLYPEQYINKDFHRCLIAIEAFRDWARIAHLAGLVELIDTYVNHALTLSETDLGIEWQDGVFVKKGAAVLDKQLVNDPLHWLSEGQYESVRIPYEKALRHFLESETRTELRADAITDAYEAIEALAKIVLGNDRDLSANQEKFFSVLDVSNEFKSLLREYISFANNFRHASTKKPKPELSRAETESFIYLTGMFIRLSIQRLPKSKTA